MTLQRFILFPFFLVLIAFIVGCSGGPSPSQSTGGGYYKDDGPGSGLPKDLHAIPNAAPRIEPYAPANMRPYTVLGQSYTPLTSKEPFRQTGHASWYGKKFHGRKTANGETYDMYAMTAAHPTLPLPSYAKVTRPQTGQSIIVRINDRGPFHRNRIIDLSYVAAAKLGLITPGSGAVIVEAITHDDIRSGRYQDATPPPSEAAADLDIFVADLPSQNLETGLGFDKPSPETLPSNLSPISGNGLPQVFLQFGAYRNAQSATELATQLNQDIGELDYRDAHIEPAGDLFRVQIGPYASRAEALNAAQMIESETGHIPHLAVR